MGLPAIDRALSENRLFRPGAGGSIPAPLAAALGAISLNAATIREVNAGRGDNPRAVIVLQDVHLNAEAQRNIASVLFSLEKKASGGGKFLVGVEGAFGRFDFAPFRSFSNKAVLKALADYFLDENRFAAPSYVGITSEKESAGFLGVDDRPHYEANVAAYLEAERTRPAILRALAREDVALAAAKRSTLNPALARFDAECERHGRAAEGLGDYLTYLTGAAGEDAGELVVRRFLTAYRIERELDFSQVERERAAIVEKLAAVITPDELHELVALGLAYRSGRVSFAGYYGGIKALIDRHGLSLAGAPAFDAYIRYVVLAGGISGDELTAAVDRLEARVLAALCRTTAEKDAMERTRRLRLVKKLVSFSLTSAEWDAYTRLRAVGGALAGAQELTADQLRPFERFYEEADARSDRMMKTMLAGANGARPAVLVVGGFHTPRLARLLREAGAAYAIVQPKIARLDGASGTEYLSIFTKEKTPLDRLFEGDRLFLSPVQVANWPNRPASGFFSLLAGLYSALVDRLGLFNAAHVRVESISGDRFRVTNALDGTTFEVSTTAEDGAAPIAPNGLPRTFWRRVSGTRTALREIFASQWADFVDRHVPRNAVERLQGLYGQSIILRTQAWGLLGGTVLGAGLAGVAVILSGATPGLAFIGLAAFLAGTVGAVTGNVAGHLYYLWNFAERLRWIRLTIPSARGPGTGASSTAAGPGALARAPWMPSPLGEAFRDVPEFERDYARRFDRASGEKRAEEILADPAAAGDLASITIDGRLTSTSVVVDRELLARGWTTVRTRLLLQKLYDAANPAEKARLRALFTRDRGEGGLVIGLLPRLDNQWPSDRLVERVDGAHDGYALVGLNEYAVEAEMSDALLGAQLMAGALGASAARSAEVYAALGGTGSMDKAVRDWRAVIEDRRYNVNRVVARTFIESQSERYRLISSDRDEMPDVYRGVSDIANRLLEAAGYDPANFHLHLADYSEGNAFVISFSNHIVINAGLLWELVDTYLGDNPTPDQLDGFFQETVAFILAHEISHIKQGRDKVNRGEAPKRETFEEMRERMSRPENEIWKERLDRHAEDYAEEIDADSNAVILMDRAGYNVREAPRAFQLMYVVEERRKAKMNKVERRRAAIARAMDEHPEMRERIRNIERRVRGRFSKNEYQAPTSFPPAFFAQLMSWPAHGRPTYQRTRMRNFQRQVLSVETRDELSQAIADARDYKELDVASTYGPFGAVEARARRVLQDSRNPITRRLHKLYARMQKAQNRAYARARATFIRQSRQKSYLEAANDFFRLRPSFPWMRHLGALWLETEVGEDKDVDKTLTEWLIAYVLSGRQSVELSFDSSFSGSSMLNVPRGLRDLLQEAARDMQPEVNAFTTELLAILRDFAAQDGLTEDIAAVRQGLSDRLTALDAQPRTLNQEIRRNQALSAIRGFYGKNAGEFLPPAVEDHEPGRWEAPVREAARRASKAELIGALDAVLASAWTPDPLPTDGKARDRSEFLSIGFLGGGHNSDRAIYFADITSQSLSEIESVIAERAAEFSFDDLLALMERMAQFRETMKKKYGDNGAASHVGFGTMKMIMRRIDGNAALASPAVMGRILRVWLDFPSMLDEGQGEAASFLYRHFIADPANYERFRSDLFFLMRRTRVHVYLDSAGRFATDYGATSRDLVEYFLDQYEAGALSSHPYFSTSGHNSGHPERVLLEMVDLFSGLPDYHGERRRAMDLIEETFGIHSDPERRLQFYEAVLEAVAGRGLERLRYPATERHGVPSFTLAHDVTTRARMVLEGALSWAELRQAYAAQLDRSAQDGEIGQVLEFANRSGLFEPLGGRPELYRVKPGVDEGRLNDAIRPLVAERREGASELAAARHARRVVDAKAGQLGVTLPADLHPEVERLMYVYAIGGFLSTDQFYETIAEGLAPGRADRWPLMDLKVLFRFLSALTPERDKWNFTDEGNEPATWSAYLVGLGFAIAHEEFGFAEPTEFGFDAGIRGRKQDRNPYFAFLGELPYEPTTRRTGMYHQFGDFEVDSAEMVVNDAVKRSPTKSVDRAHLQDMPIDRLLSVFGFVNNKPEWGFNEWVAWARANMPPSATRNTFLYYILWTKAIKADPRFRNVDVSRFYDWVFTVRDLTRALSSGRPEDNERLKAAVQTVLPLLVEDTRIQKLNTMGLNSLLKHFAASGDRHDVRGATRNALDLPFKLLTFATSELVIGAAALSVRLLGLLLWPLPSFIAERVTRVVAAIIGWLVFHSSMLFDDLSSVMFAASLRVISTPKQLGTAIRLFHAKNLIDWYADFRNFSMIRVVLSVYFSFLRLFERAPRTPWQFNEPGNIHSQPDLMVAAPFRGVLLERSRDAAAPWADRLMEIERLFPRSTPVRDEFLVELARSVLTSTAAPQDKLGALKQIYPKMHQAFFRDQYALRALDLDLDIRGAVTFEEETHLIVEVYFPDFSFTRDDLLAEVMERAKKPEAYRRLSGYILQNQDNVTKDEVRQKILGENRIRETLQKAPNTDKMEFALWIMGVRRTKPFFIREIEFLYKIDLDYLKQLFNESRSTHYSTVGDSAKRDIMEALFGGAKGLMQDRRLFQRFLTEVFDKNVPRGVASRASLKKAFLAIFRHASEEQKLETIGAIATKMRPGVAPDPAVLIRTFLESFGLIGIKIGQIISHSDMKLDPKMRAALEQLSSSADPLGKKNVFQFMELVFGDDFNQHFEAVLNRLGSASIKLVYELSLADGSRAVLKLKRPQIDKLIDEQLRVFEDVLADLRASGLKIPPGLAAQVAKYIREEIDFTIERRNQERFIAGQTARRQNLAIADGAATRRIDFTAPRSLESLDQLLPPALRDNVAIFEQKVEGAIPLNQTERLRTELGLSESAIRELKRTVFDELIQQMFVDGFFHADPHGGNILVRAKNGSGDLEVVFIDLGSMGKIETPAERQQLAQWLMYAGLHPNEAPPIPDDKILEATFFKKVPYLLESVDKFYIAEKVFAALGYTLPPASEPAARIRAVRLASQGRWDKIAAGDMSAGWRERAEAFLLRVFRRGGRSEPPAPPAMTNAATMGAWMGLFRRFTPFLYNWAGVLLIRTFVAFWWESPQTLSRARFVDSHFRGEGPWTLPDTPQNRSAIRRAADLIFWATIAGLVIGTLAGIFLLLAADLRTLTVTASAIASALGLAFGGAVAGNWTAHFAVNLLASLSFLFRLHVARVQIETVFAGDVPTPGEALFARSQISVDPARNVLERVLPVANLGLNARTVAANPEVRLSERDLYALSLLADGRSATALDAATCALQRGPAIRVDVEIKVLDAADPAFAAKAAMVTRAGTGRPVLVFARNLTDAQRALLGGLPVISDLTSQAIQDVAARNRWVVKTLDVQFLSNGRGVINESTLASLEALQSGDREQPDGYAVSLHMAVILSGLMVLVPVTRGELERMLDLEIKVQRVVAAQA